MSEFKFCESCGNKISIAALFCPKCGHKQEPITVPEPTLPTESIEQEFTNDTSDINEEPVISQEPVETEEQIIDENPINDETIMDKTDDVDQITGTDNETINEPVTEPVKAEADPPVITENVKPATQETQNTYNQQPYSIQPQSEQPQTMQWQQPQPVIQPLPQQTIKPQPQYQTPYSPQTVQTNGAVQKTGTAKKKFPWIFSVLWIVLLAAVGIWAYFLLVDPNYDYPRFTEDAQRIALFTASIAALIYTLSLKLTMKKLKVLPTVILVVLALAGFFFFCLVELQEGNWLHDTVSNLIEIVSP